MVPIFKGLEDDGFGVFKEDGKKEGFLKKYPLTDHQLEILDTNAEEYRNTLLGESRNISESQKNWLMSQGGSKIAEALLSTLPSPRKDGNSAPSEEPDPVAEEGSDTEEEPAEEPRPSRTSKRSFYKNYESSRSKGKRSRRK